jgi:hypothetical protein
MAMGGREDRRKGEGIIEGRGEGRKLKGGKN